MIKKEILNIVPVQVLTTREAVVRQLFTEDEIVAGIKNVCRHTLGTFNDSIPDDERRRIFSCYPEHCHILIVHGKIAGVWSFLSLRAESFAKIKGGELLEKQITLEDISKLTDSDINYGYCLELAVLEKYRKHTLLLVNSFISQLEEFAGRGIFFPEWCTRACSPKGDHLCDVFGLNKVLSLENIGYRGTLFFGDMTSVFSKPLVKKCYSLTSLYINKFGNPIKSF